MPPEVSRAAARLRNEYVVCVRGVLRARKDPNPKIPTGQVGKGPGWGSQRTASVGRCGATAWLLRFAGTAGSFWCINPIRRVAAGHPYAAAGRPSYCATFAKLDTSAFPLQQFAVSVDTGI